jgi:hypothetical protein
MTPDHAFMIVTGLWAGCAVGAAVHEEGGWTLLFTAVFVLCLHHAWGMP